MNYLSVGDMARSFQFRSHNTQLKQNLSRLSAEVVSGVQSDMARSVGGDFSIISSLDTSLARLSAFSRITSQVGLMASAQQTALEQIQERLKNSSVTFLSAATDSETAALNIKLSNARYEFDAVLNVLETRISGRYIFSGSDTQTAPLAGGQTILDALSSEISGMNSADDMLNAISDWFDAPRGGGGYLDTVYFGSGNPIGGVKISPNDKVSLSISAESHGIRNALKSLAVAALISENSVPEGSDIRKTLARTAGEWMVAADSALIDLRGTLGQAEAEISQGVATNSAQKISLDIARNKLVEADPFETASALQAAESQIDTLYTIAARLSRLTFTNYL